MPRRSIHMLWFIVLALFIAWRGMVAKEVYAGAMELHEALGIDSTVQPVRSREEQVIKARKGWAKRRRRLQDRYAVAGLAKPHRREMVGSKMRCCDSGARMGMPHARRWKRARRIDLAGAPLRYRALWPGMPGRAGAREMMEDRVVGSASCWGRTDREEPPPTSRMIGPGWSAG